VRTFFIHLHKTAGTSFGKMLSRLFPQDSIFPNEQDQLATRRHYPDLTPEIHDFLNLSAERLDSIRLLCGHYPFLAGSAFSPEPRYLVFFRHPLARTISHLKHARRYVPEFQDKTLAEIFEVRRARQLFFGNAQTKAFSYHTFEEALRVDDPIEVDCSRLALAKENILKCEFVGLTEAFAESVALCERIFGWTFDDVLRENVAPEDLAVEDPLRERILNEAALDLELYDFASRVHGDLRAAHPPSSYS